MIVRKIHFSYLRARYNFFKMYNSNLTLAKYLHNTPPRKPKKGQNSWKSRWWSGALESRVYGAVFLGIASWLIDSSINRKNKKRKLELLIINDKLKNLYGPLYGNRLVRITAFKAAIGDSIDVEEYLKKAEENKDAEMIKNWRNYVIKVLLPLDQKAEELILNQAHMVANNGKFPEEFENFLKDFSHFKFIIQSWKTPDGEWEKTSEFSDDDYLVKSNISTCDEEIFKHVKTRYNKLLMRQQILTLDGSDDQQDTKLTQKLFKVFKF